MKDRKAIHFVLIMTCCLVLIACDKVPMPTSDSTPPTLTWVVKNQTTNRSQDISGSGSVHAKGNETLFITLRGRDPEGVSFIELGGAYRKLCVTSGGLQKVIEGVVTAQSHFLSPDADNKVSTTTIEAMTVQADKGCSGDTWHSTAVILKGLARNYFSGETTGSLTITFVP